MTDSKTCYYRKRLKTLRMELESQGWSTHWKDIVDWILPREGRYLNGDVTNQNNDGRKKHHKIINGATSDALRTLAAGMQGGLTSPSRPWFALNVPDKSLNDYKPVRNWLHEVRERMLSVFARSNFYGSVHTVYWQVGAFGTGAMMIDEDFDTIIRCRPFTIGEYMLSLDSSYRPDALYRQFSMKACQMRDQFGEENLPQSVKTALRNNQPDTYFEVVHVVEKNYKLDEDKADHRGMKYKSVYFPLCADSEDQILKESGYHTIPFVGPRWKVSGVDTYGTAPAMDALGDVKMLQKLEEKKLKAIDKMVDPPMNAPSSMRQTGGTIIAGGVNYVDTMQGGQGFAPAYQVQFDVNAVSIEIQNVERRIQKAFYNDLFLAVLNQTKQMTATEVAQRHEEKLVMLGPVLERLQSEYLNPIIDRTFDIMNRMGMIPPPPPELQGGMPINVDYISTLAQAQKAVGTSSIEQFAGFVGSMAAANPEVLDKVNFDETADIYGTSLGVPPTIIRSEEEVDQIRQARNQKMQQQQMLAMAPQLAKAAKDVSQAPVQGGDTTILDRMTGAEGSSK